MSTQRTEEGRRSIGVGVMLRVFAGFWTALWVLPFELQTS